MKLPLVPADYVTSEQGTGFVPCAPAHGEDEAVCPATGERYQLRGDVVTRSVK